MKISVMTGAALLLTVATAAAQGAMRLDGSLPSLETPKILQQATVDQKMDAQIPLDLPFRDETGREVTLREYFGRERPVILAPVYYECPMLCTQVLNGLVSALGVITLDPGRDFDVVALSFNPKETPGLARDKKANYMARFDRPGTEGGFHFLTGEESSIAPVLDAVGFRYAYDPAIGQYAHPATVIVLTPDGRVSKYFLGIEYSPRDLRFGLVEASQGHIGTAIERAVITWCYHYDPASGTYGLLTMRLVQAGGILTILGLCVFWYVMWRREHAPGRDHTPEAPANSYGR
ncbi:MAG TPA: SCO family protein [Vicinamibacterales bacterium]